MGLWALTKLEDSESGIEHNLEKRMREPGMLVTISLRVETGNGGDGRKGGDLDHQVVDADTD